MTAPARRERGLLDRARTSARWLRHSASGVRGWRAAARGSQEPVVYYGHPSIPGTKTIGVGGIVKFQSLQQQYPNSPEGFNVLCLVSSSLPHSIEPFAWAAKQKGAKLVWNQNGVAYPGWHGPGWERTNEPLSALLHMADFVFYQSEFCRQSADRFLGPRSQSAEILYNAADTAAFVPRPARAGDNADLTLLLAGTQYQYYRLDTALRTLAAVVRERPATRLVIAGDLTWLSDRSEALAVAKALAAELGILDRVSFVGGYTQDEAPALFASADILLHTKYNDPCPTAVIEAMAAGLPVVYSRSGGVPELVGDEAGISVQADLSWEQDLEPDPQLMAEAVLEVAANLPRFAEAARQRAVDRFDIAHWRQRYQEVFEMVLAR